MTRRMLMFVVFALVLCGIAQGENVTVDLAQTNFIATIGQTITINGTIANHSGLDLTIGAMYAGQDPTNYGDFFYGPDAYNPLVIAVGETYNGILATMLVKTPGLGKENLFFQFYNAGACDYWSFDCAGPNLETTNTVSFTVNGPVNSPVPEPASLALFGSGVLALGSRLRRKFFA